MAAYLTRCERACDGYIIAWSVQSQLMWNATLAAVRRLPCALREYLPDEKSWWVADAAIYQLARVFANFDAALDLDPAVYGNRGRRTGMRDRASSTLGVPGDVARAFSTLYLVPDAPALAINAVYRALAKAHHPDAGGDEVQMKRLSAARDVALAWVEERAPAHAA